MRKIGIFLGVAALVAVSAIPMSSQAAANLLEGHKAEITMLSKKGVPGEWGESVAARTIDRLGYRQTFSIDDPSQWLALTLTQPETVAELSLNGQKVDLPVDGIFYRTVPGIPASLLKKGENVLLAKTTVTKKVKKRFKKRGGKAKQVLASGGGFALKGMTAADLALQTGPVVGNACQTSVRIACRVNMPAEVRLVFGDQKLSSESGLMHMFDVTGLSAGSKYNYKLQGRTSASDAWKDLSKSYAVQTYPESGDFEFIAMGDSRSTPEVWEKVSKAAADKNPLFCAFAGDMVTVGTQNWLWDYEFFNPGKDFLASVPFYAVIGNHEDESPLFNKVFPTPSGTTTWVQQIGSVQLIGIDGDKDWSAGSENAVWLEEQLAQSTAQYIFLCSHYPAWSSGKHGRLVDGEPKERQFREGQDVIMPLLEKYNATAMIAGHDHCYERSEPPVGVTMIITGGAGTDVNEKYKEAEVQNPHSEVFNAVHHYCLFMVRENECVMTALTPEGEVIDTRTWPARKLAAVAQ